MGRHLSLDICLFDCLFCLFDKEIIMGQFLLLISFAMLCCIIIPSTNGECSYKIEVDCNECDKGSHAEEPNIYKYYYAQPGTVGGKAHYKSSDGDHVIWYHSRRGKWHFGKDENLGTDYRHAEVASDHECPYSPAYTWQYYNNDAAEWYDADKTLSIWSRSK